jgi:hypothetical protein
MVVGYLVAMFLVVCRSDVPTYAGGFRLAGRAWIRKDVGQRSRELLTVMYED